MIWLESIEKDRSVSAFDESLSCILALWVLFWYKVNFYMRKKPVIAAVHPLVIMVTDPYVARDSSRCAPLSGRDS